MLVESAVKSISAIGKGIPGGKFVTVCIAVKSSPHERMVFVSDRLMSDDASSVDTALKIAPIDPDRTAWIVMFAGHAPHFAPLREQIRNRLNCDDLGHVISACEGAYRAELKKRIDGEILLPYGWTREEFFANGRSMLDDYRFGAIADQIGQMQLGIELLIGGFDSSGEQHILEMSGAGIITRIDQLGFHAIGNGRFLALGALYPFLEVGYADEFSEVVYRTIAAKFAAESAPGVGPETMAMSLSRSGPDAALFGADLLELRAKWLPAVRPPVPEGALEIISKSLLPLH